MMQKEEKNLGDVTAEGRKKTSVQSLLQRFVKGMHDTFKKKSY